MEQRTLSNSCVCIATQTPTTQKASVMAYIRAGTVFEDIATNGVSHALEHILLQGTESHPTAGAFYDHLSDNQLTVTGLTTKQYVALGIEGHRDTLEGAVSDLCDMINHPILSNTLFNTERKVLGEEIARAASDSADILNHEIDAKLFEGSPLSLPVEGSEGSVTDLTLDNLKHFYNNFYQPANMVLAIAADHPPDRSVDMAETYFGKVQGDTAHTFPHLTFPHIDLGHTEFSHEGMGDRTLLTCTFLTQDTFERRESIIWILSEALNDHLFRSLREKHGLVYYVHADWQRYFFGNRIDIDVECSLKNRDSVIKILREEVGSFHVTDATFENAKRKLVQTLELLHEDPVAVTDYGGIQYLLFTSLQTPEEERAFIEELTPEDVNKATNVVFKEVRSGLFSIQSRN